MSQSFGSKENNRSVGGGGMQVHEFDNGTVCFKVVDSDNFNKSDKEIFLNGIPLRLFEDGSGNLALPFVTDSQVEESDEHLFELGLPLRVGKKNDQQFFLIFNDGSEPTSPKLEFWWRGISLAQNENGVFLTRLLDKNDPDEEDVLFLGGMPLVIQRFSDDWHLVAKDVS